MTLVGREAGLGRAPAPARRPVALYATAAPTSARPLSSHPGGGHIRRVPAPTVLVIDDELQIRRVVRHALEADGARVLEAASGREGADVAAAERPDLVVLDLGLPDGPGIDVCRGLRAWSAAPVVVLSARHSDAEKAALLDAGADDYVTKPFSPVEFRARVRAQLRRARMAGAAPGGARIEAGGLVVDLAVVGGGGPRGGRAGGEESAGGGGGRGPRGGGGGPPPAGGPPGPGPGGAGPAPG